MAIEISSDRAVCHRCGMAFGKRKGNFPVSYAQLHKGVGTLPICKKCFEDLYLSFLERYDDPSKAIQTLCRKLDLYWNENIYKSLIKKNGTTPLASMYLQRLTITKYAGKSYDDTLEEEQDFQKKEDHVSIEPDTINTNPAMVIEDIPDDVLKFWGTGYTAEMYKQLEERREYWMSGLPDEFDTGVGSEAIIKQICSLELDINRERAKGNNVDKLVSTLSGLIGSLNLKPSQKKSDDDTGLTNTPLGVWLYRYENERPLPVVEDENKIRKTVFTWMGHVCKMLGKKNAYVKLYEDEISRLRVERPEFEEEDDEAFMMDVLTSSDGGDSP